MKKKALGDQRNVSLCDGSKYCGMIDGIREYKHGLSAGWEKKEGLEPLNSVGRSLEAVRNAGVLSNSVEDSPSGMGNIT
ncbi:hypothetical protein ACQKDS_18475 [Serratia sp. NPDC078593]|uniref:hypothetical protein n=1 Tax=unclassified Serratia (in: enterobacteria) TaxID=2647522 RepID=UPI0037D00BBA